MRVSLDWTATAVINRNDKAQTIRLRSTQPIVVNGEALEPSDNGLTDLDLNATQTERFRALLGDAEGLAAAAAQGYIEFPDGTPKGKPLATGPSLASFLPAPEAPAKGKAK